MNLTLEMGIANALHLLAAIIWIGGMVFVLFALRPALAQLEPAVRLPFFTRVLSRFFLIVWHAVVVILVSGYWLLFRGFGGFASSPAYVHVMHLAGLVMSGLFVFLFFRYFRPLRAAVKRAEWKAAAPYVESLRRVVSINLLLGLLIVCVVTIGRYV